MFDALLGRKFTVKCKQAIKCIKERLRLIRKRKQAMLNFLKQDIADLLRNGHDSHAFNRMDALIVEINHLACYDMIEKFCEGILRQLSLLQKQRECPPEDREAVSTLIFAAARFSDLPELCDLRHVFMARYGSAMETSVNLEFKEKLSSRSFLMDTKIQLMHNIAQELSVKWDSESFEYWITDPKANECVNEKNEKKSDGTYEPSINTVKDVVAETKDIHIIGHEPEPTRKSKICDDEPENVNPNPPDTSIPHYVKPKRNKDSNFMEERQRKVGTRRSPRAREVLEPIDQEGKVFEEMKSNDDCRGGSKVPALVNGEPDGTDAEYWHDDHTIHNKSSRARGKLDPICQEGNATVQLRSMDDSNARSIVSPFIKLESNGSDADDLHENDTHFKRSSKARMQHRGERRHAVGRYEFEDNDKYIKVHHVKPKGIKDAADSDDNGKHAAGEHEFEDNDKPIKIPPYVKPKAVKDVIHSDDWDKDGIVNGKSAKTGKHADLAAQEGQSVGPWKSNHDRAFHMIPPPYVKPNVSALSSHDKPSSPPTNEGGFAASDKSSTRRYKVPQKDELAVDYERPKPRSVRRINQKSPVVQESDDTVDGDEPIPRIQHGQRRHAARKGSFTPPDDYDSDDEVIDRLLIHYSKKKTLHQSRKHRERTKAHLADQVMDDCGVGQHQTYDRYHINRPESLQALHVEHVDDDKAARHQPDGRLRTYMPEPEPVQAPADRYVEGGARKHQTFSRHAIHKPQSTQAFSEYHVVDYSEAGRRGSNGRDRIHKPGSAQSFPIEHMDHGESGQRQTFLRHHTDKPELVHPPGRAVSLPPEPVSVEEKAKGPARAISMQSDSVSPPGRRTHPGLPDYEELAARFAALKRG